MTEGKRVAHGRLVSSIARQPGAINESTRSMLKAASGLSRNHAVETQAVAPWIFA